MPVDPHDEGVQDGQVQGVLGAGVRHGPCIVRGPRVVCRADRGLRLPAHDLTMPEDAVGLLGQSLGSAVGGAGAEIERNDNRHQATDRKHEQPGSSVWQR